MAKIFIGHQDINYLQRLLTKTAFFENRLIESITKPKDLWKALRSLGLPSKTFSGEVNTLKIKNTDENDVDSVLEDFRNYHSTLADNLVKILPKPTNTVIKYYEHMIVDDYCHLTPVSQTQF